MYLVINLGLKSIRGIIFSERNDQVYSSAYPVHTTLFNEKVEQDPHEWQVLLDRIFLDIKNKTDLSSGIEYVTVTTSSSCILGLNEEGEPVTPVMMVSDKRAASISIEISSDHNFITASERFGLTCPASSLIPKALWYRRNDIQKFNRTRWWLGAGEYLSYLITGDIYTDPLNASKSFYAGGQYHFELLDQYGIDIQTLPPVVSIGSVYEVNGDVVHRYGLPQNCQFIVSTYDAICAVLGSSNGDGSNACDVSGTVTSVRVLTERQDIKSSGALLNQKIDPFNRTLVGSSNNLGGGIIEWYKQAFFQEGDKDVYQKLENAALKCKPGADGLIFLPYLLGERAPFVNPNATASFFGIRRQSNESHFARAVFESTAFVSKDLLDLISSSGIELSSLTVSGGLARFDLINQIKADVSGLPVNVVENFESTSIGALVVLKLSIGHYNNLTEALSDLVKIRKVIHPSTKNNLLYDNMFQLYKDLNGSLESSYLANMKIQEGSKGHQNETVQNL
ncbi:MAG: sugar (pentulose or hexulose) kinase [Nonlabens sp.]|jgi:sugar (pentulose or hexulose) kinase